MLSRLFGRQAHAAPAADRFSVAGLECVRSSLPVWSAWRCGNVPILFFCLLVRPSLSTLLQWLIPHTCRSLHAILQKQRALGRAADPSLVVDTLKQIGELMVFGDRESERRNNDRFFE
jgi:hypothetical protein